MMCRHSCPRECARKQSINVHPPGLFRQELTGADGLLFANGGEFDVRPAGEGFLASRILAIPDGVSVTGEDESVDWSDGFWRGERIAQ